VNGKCSGNTPVRWSSSVAIPQLRLGRFPDGGRRRVDMIFISCGTFDFLVHT